MASATTEIVVLGGGPAGASASSLLASWGHAVRLITRPRTGHALAVSLPPSCAKLFNAIGVSAAIERANFIRSRGNTVWWGADAARIEPFSNGALGWQVELAELESLLVDHARECGVVVEHQLVTPEHLSASSLSADFVLDCTGQAGALARARQLRQYEAGPKTIAIAGEWRKTNWRLTDDTHTLVESYADGWMWSVPLRSGGRHVAAMIDPQRSELARAGSSRETYLAEIAKTRAFKALLSDAAPIDGPWGFDVSPYFAREYAGDGWLLVGDAASFIDPLSSAGVKKALASAWLAAVVVHTSLKRPAMKEQAVAFYAARERELADHHRAESRAFLTRAAREHDRPFWIDRSDEAIQSNDEDSAAVRAAFDRLRRERTLCVSRSASIRIDDRPIVAGNEITMSPHIMTSPTDGVRYLYNVDMVILLELAPTVSQVGDLFDAYCRRAGPVPLPQLLLALSTALARGWLVAQWPPT